MSYTIYSENTGEILRIIQCDENQLNAQLKFGERSIVGSYIDHYIELGVPVPIPTKPTETSIFDYTTKTWRETLTVEVQWVRVKVMRNQLLQASDWTQLPDVPLATKEAWAAYRQALRDITTKPDPFNITWPEPPSS